MKKMNMQSSGLTRDTHNGENPLWLRRLSCARKDSRKAAFSLVEVTLAIGIVSFVVVSILGTFSVGLATIHDAKNDMTHAQIVAQVSSTVLQTPFDQVDAYAGTSPFYFDQTGKQLPSVTGALYSVKLVAVAGGATTYPGASATLSSSAKTVQITVSTVRPGTSTAMTNAPVTRSSLIVPKS